MSAINQRSSEKVNQDDQIMVINKNLSETIQQIEQRNQTLSVEIGALKSYKKLYKNAENI